MRDAAFQATAALDHLRRLGVPARTSVIWTEHTDPALGSPGGPLEKVAFTDQRINHGMVADRSYGSVELGGVVEVYASPPDAPDDDVRVIRYENLVLRLSPHLTAQQACEYAGLLSRLTLAVPA